MTVEEFIACPDRSSPVDFIENLHHDLRFVDVRITTPYYNLQIRPEFEVAQFLLLSALGRSIVLSKVVNGNEIFVGHSHGISRANGIPDSLLDYFVRSEVPVAIYNLLYTC